MTSAKQWLGCHGVRIENEAVNLGRVSGTPLADATVRFGPVQPPDGEVLWVQHAVADVDGERFEVDRELHRRSNGALVLTGSVGPTLEVDQTSATITIDEGAEAYQLQLLVTFGLPLILHATGDLVLHGSACTLSDHTIVVCGDSGAGKSSLLVGLVDAGWSAISEDLCAIDFRTPAPTVWPGPPWVRIGHGTAGPMRSGQRFDSPYKTGWDIGPVQAAEPRAISQVVLLQSPGGDAPVFEPVSRPVALRELAPHAVWVGDQDERARQLFGPTAQLVARVPTMRLRLPRSDSWLDAVPSLLASGI